VAKTITITVMDEAGDEAEHELPARMEVCSDCEGHGTVLNESMRHHAYTAEEFREFDEEEVRAYFTRGGMYDVTCPTCGGANVVSVVDEERLDPEQREAFEAFRKQEIEWANADAQDRLYQRMESGGY
jgi:adenine-specific DNA methylase